MMDVRLFEEVTRLLENHKAVYHGGDVGSTCALCKSIRRVAVKEIGKI